MLTVSSAALLFFRDRSGGDLTAGGRDFAGLADFKRLGKGQRYAAAIIILVRYRSADNLHCASDNSETHCGIIAVAAEVIFNFRERFNRAGEAFFINTWPIIFKANDHTAVLRP